MKKFLFILLALVYLTVLFTGPSSKENELHIYIWPDFIKPELIERFEKEHNAHVIFDSFDSNESMYAKLKMGATGYDIIFPSGYMFELMKEQDLFAEIKADELNNLKHLDPSFLDKAPLFGVPFAITYTGIGYRKDRLKIEDPSWNIFADAAYKGRMTMLNDIREGLGSALKFLGYSINTNKQEELDLAVKQLLIWKKNLAKFESEQNKHGLSSAEYLVVQGYNGDMLQVMQENQKVDFFYPKEGSIISVDYAAIMKNSSNIELAKKFINFLLAPEVAAENIQFTLFSSPNLSAIKLLPKELQENEALFPSKAILQKSEMIRYLGKDNELYNKAWDRVKKE